LNELAGRSGDGDRPDHFTVSPFWLRPSLGWRERWRRGRIDFCAFRQSLLPATGERNR
jgi:hypothetical protein